MSDFEKQILTMLATQSEELEALNTAVGALVQDVKIIKEDVRITRKLVDEAFKDILMLDNRTESLIRVK